MSDDVHAPDGLGNLSARYAVRANPMERKGRDELWPPAEPRASPISSPPVYRGTRAPRIPAARAHPKATQEERIRSSSNPWHGISR